MNSRVYDMIFIKQLKITYLEIIFIYLHPQPQAVVAHENQRRETYYDNPLVDIMAFWQKSAIAWIEAYDNFLRML
jgi:hypothetical protein